MNDENKDENELPENSNTSKVSRGALQVAGAVPFVGGVFSAIAGAWSEKEKNRVRSFHAREKNSRKNRVRSFHATLN